MRFILRNWWKLGFALIAAGIVLLLIGWTMGARGGSMYVDSDGFHVSSQSENKDSTINETELSRFSDADISTISADIEFIASDHYGLEARLPNTGGAPEWGVNNGKLTVNAKYNEFSINLFNFTPGNQYYVRVYYPEGAEFSGIKLDTSSGDITLSNISVRELTVNNVSGRVKADITGYSSAAVYTSSGDTILSGMGNSANVSVKSVSGSIEAGLDGCAEADVSSSSGDISLTGGAGTTLNAVSVSGAINVDNAVLKTVTAKTSSGGVKITGDVRGQSSVNSVSGDVTLRFSVPAPQYSYDLSSVSGAITVDGQRMGSPARPANAPQNGNMVTVSTSSGSIRLNFGE